MQSFIHEAPELSLTLHHRKVTRTFQTADHTPRSNISSLQTQQAMNYKSEELFNAGYK